MAIIVKLRQKAISGDRHSLYLDFYPPIPDPKTGNPTRRQFLKLYVYDKPKTASDKLHNKETMLLAGQIRQKRDNEVNKPEIYTDFEKEILRIKELGNHSFTAYFKQLADKRKSSNYDNWISAYKYLMAFTKGNLKFADVNIKGSLKSGFIAGDSPAVCFQDAPLYGLTQNLIHEQYFQKDLI